MAYIFLMLVNVIYIQANVKSIAIRPYSIIMRQIAICFDNIRQTNMSIFINIFHLTVNVVNVRFMFK